MNSLWLSLMKEHNSIRKEFQKASEEMTESKENFKLVDWLDYQEHFEHLTKRFEKNIEEYEHIYGALDARAQFETERNRQKLAQMKQFIIDNIKTFTVNAQTRN